MHFLGGGSSLPAITDENGLMDSPTGSDGGLTPHLDLGLEMQSVHTLYELKRSDALISRKEICWDLYLT